MALFTVCIDAGHGGKDDGIKRADLVEKDITLDLALQLGEKLKGVDGLRVAYTRTGDHHRTLSERAQFANNLECDLYISIHVNGIPGHSRAHGADMFHWPGNESGEQIANMIASWMPNCLKTKDRKSTRLNSSHSQQSRMPSSA